MHPTTTTLRPALLAAALTAIFAAQAPAHAQSNDRIRGTPSEANHFIETPRGWQHPKTAWGEPDIQAQLNMMQAAGIPLERCANSYRAALPPGAAPPPGPAGGVGAPAAAVRHEQEVAHGRGVRAAHGGVAHSRRREPAVRGAGQLGPRDDDGPHRSEHSAAADEPHREPGERAAAAADARRQAPRVAREERLGAARRDDRVRRPQRLR